MDSFFPASFISHYYIAYKLGRISYENFIYGYTDTSIETAAIGAIALNAEVIGNYLQAHTAPDDLIYLATESVQSYYYADRKPPVEILWPDFLFVTGSADQVFDPRTKYIVLDKPERMEHPQWLMDRLARDFYVETIIGDHEIYRRQSH